MHGAKQWGPQKINDLDLGFTAIWDTCRYRPTCVMQDKVFSWWMMDFCVCLCSDIGKSSCLYRGKAISVPLSVSHSTVELTYIHNDQRTCACCRIVWATSNNTTFYLVDTWERNKQIPPVVNSHIDFSSINLPQLLTTRFCALNIKYLFTGYCYGFKCKFLIIITFLFVDHLQVITLMKILLIRKRLILCPDKTNCANDPMSVYFYKGNTRRAKSVFLNSSPSRK